MANRSFIGLAFLAFTLGCLWWYWEVSAWRGPVAYTNDDEGLEISPFANGDQSIESAHAAGSGDALPDSNIPENYAHDAEIVLDAIAHGEDLLQALDQRAAASSWSDQELGEAVAFWAALCGPALAPEQWRWRSAMPVAYSVREVAVDTCRSYLDGPDKLAFKYDEVFLQHYQSGEAEFEVISRRLQERLHPVEFRHLIQQLRDALGDVRFERVRDVVWALHAFDLFEHQDLENSSSAGPVLRQRPFVSTMVLEGIGSKLMCRQLGGCGRQHPLLLRICSIDPQRPCLQPTTIDDAISDVLMGYELEQYDRLLLQIERGLARMDQ